MRSAILNFNVSSAVAIRRSTYKIQKKKINLFHSHIPTTFNIQATRLYSVKIVQLILEFNFQFPREIILKRKQ